VGGFTTDDPVTGMQKPAALLWYPTGQLCKFVGKFDTGSQKPDGLL